MKKLDEEVIEAIKDSNGCNVYVDLLGNKEEGKSILGSIESKVIIDKNNNYQREETLSVPEKIEDRDTVEIVLNLLYSLIFDKYKIPEQKEVISTFFVNENSNLFYRLRLKQIEYCYSKEFGELISVYFKFEHVSSSIVNKGD